MKKDIKFKLWGRIFILPQKVKYIFIVLVVVAVIAAGFFIQGQEQEDVTVMTYAPTATPSPTTAIQPTATTTIHVYVVGEVKIPGVYELTAGSMVSNAVDAAGGFTELADREAINMVEILTSNTMIKVPAKGEIFSDVIISGDGDGSGTQESGTRVNINTADIDELCTLSGVGESTAKKIISYRKTNGPFVTIEDIMNVPGIKEAKFMAFKEDICVG